MTRADHFEAGTLRVRVRVPTGRAAPPGLRGQLARLIGSADLRPAELPPSAMLIVRRLRDPLPGRLSLRGGRASVEPAWEQAVRSALARQYRGAARPALGAVPAAAEAVVFDDESEMLSCLVRDLALGRASNQWWWARVLRGTRAASPGAAIAQTLAAEPRLVPAVVARLAAAGDAASVLLALSPGDAESLARAVCSAFGITSPAFAEAVRDDSAPGWLAEVLRAAAAQASRHRLGPQRAYLLGAALAVHRSPAGAGAPAVHRALTTWAYGTGIGGDEAGGGGGGARHATATGDSAAVQSAGSPSAEATQDRWAARDDLSTAAAPPPAPAPPAAPSSLQPGIAETAPPPGASPPAPMRRDTAGAGVAASGSVGGVPAGEAVATRLAGVFYLVNMMRRLRLPAAFEPDWRLAGALGAWGTLDALARSLLDAGGVGDDDLDDDLAADGLWPVLAALAGRDADGPIGEGVVAPPVPRLPADWPAVAPRDHQPPNPGPLLDGLTPALRGWLDLVRPYVAAWLAQALDPGGPGAAADAVPLMLRRRGRLFVTAAHVDLVMPPGAVAVPVRRAGLDCDPGWAAEFGRVIKFHYA